MGRQSQFTKEEKVAAVKLMSEGRSATSVANEYGVHPNTVWKWQELYRTNPKAAFSGEPLNAEAAEVNRLKRRNAELEAEVEFLKKATAYFAKAQR
jgi:transposase